MPPKSEYLSKYRVSGLAIGLLMLLAGGTACEKQEPLPITALPEIDAELRRDLVAVRSPADGGGKARLIASASDDPVLCGSAGQWTFEYQAGELGIVPAGGLYFQVSPFWGWSTPQTSDPQRPGYTIVESLNGELEIETHTVDRQLMLVRFPNRGLSAGERIRLTYGAGSAGARSDSNAESGSRFWFAVDGDGDGIRAVLEDSPSVDVLARPPTRVVAFVPSTATIETSVIGHVALLDSVANAVRGIHAKVMLDFHGLDCRFDADVELIDGVARFAFVPLAAGVLDVEVSVQLEDGRELSARANPMLVEELVDSGAPNGGTGPLRILWGDLHGHSNLSDGTGTPDEYFHYAREFAALDFVALTDHDHFGMLALDNHPRLWRSIIDTVARFHDPGQFVALPGYEWTSWIHGHRHIVYFADDGPLHSSLDDASDHPDELWKLLTGLPALTIPHHPAGGPIAIDWGPIGPVAVEPVVEFCSAHGSSESSSTPNRIYGWRGPGLRELLDGGRRFGFIASGDSHDGHPGLTHLAPQYGHISNEDGSTRRVGNGGLVAVLARDLTRSALLEALRERRCYATNGPRIALRLKGVTTAPHGGPVDLDILGTRPLEAIEVITNEGTEALPLDRLSDRTDPRRARVVLPPDSLQGLEFMYFRILQDDGGTAWTSPIFFD